MITILGSSDDALLRSISEKRADLLNIASACGMTSDRTVSESRELDMLIAIYQRVQLDLLMRKKRNNDSEEYTLT